MLHRVKDVARQAAFIDKLRKYENESFPLSPELNDAQIETLSAQLVDSVRRIEFLNHIGRSDPVEDSRVPYSGSFNPLKGAVWLARHGQLDEAFWLIFIATITGKHKYDGWNLAEDLYGRLGEGDIWSWQEVQGQPQAFEQWLADAHPERTLAGRSRRFGNHRKFETLKPGPVGLGSSTTTYVEFLLQYGSHGDLLADAQAKVGQNPESVFGELYSRLSEVNRMGRLGRFDYLCNLSNLYLSPIYPDSCYISSSTGPIEGARLLFAGDLSPSSLDRACVDLARYLEISPQAIEDSLCNWQKDPLVYRYFRG